MSTQTTILDEQYKQNQNDLFDRAKAIADRPYQTYGTDPSDRVAGFNQFQTNFFNRAAQDFANSQAFAGNARGALQNSFSAPMERAGNYSFTQGNIQDYMNPYVDQVIDRTFRQVDRATDARRQSIRDDAIASNAFGNDRRLIMEGVAEAEGEAQKANLAANLYQNAYTSAAGLMGADMDRALTADQANIASQNSYMSNVGKNAVLGLTDVGQTNQTYAQAGDVQQQRAQEVQNQQIAEFYRAQGYDEQQARFLADMLYGQQVGTTTVTEGEAAGGGGSSSASTRLGNAATAASIAKMAGAANPYVAAAALVGGLL